MPEPVAPRDEKEPARRSWRGSVAWSMAVVLVVLAVAIGLNALLGRRIHWDIVIVFGLLGTLALVAARRYGAA